MSLPEQLSNSHSVIKHDRVRIEASTDVPSALPSQANSSAGPKSGARCRKSVQLLREKDVVRGIEVRCSCGDVTVVEIEYGPQAG